MVTAAMVMLSLTTALQSYFDPGDDSETTLFLVARLLVLPAVLLCWFLLCAGRRRRAVWPSDSAALVPLLTTGWFVLGSFFSSDPVGSGARSIALFAIVWGSLNVLGPALVKSDGGVSLVVAAFWSCLLLALFSGVASVVEESRGWGLTGERYYGPLSATTLGPI